jgi:hypothetical protein
MRASKPHPALVAEKRIQHCSIPPWCVARPAPACMIRPVPPSSQEYRMFTTAHIAPVIALIAGVLILIVPRLLSYIVAIFLILYGLTGLNEIYHFIK